MGTGCRMADPEDWSKISDDACSSGIIMQYGNGVVDTEIKEYRILNAILQVTNGHIAL